MRFLKFRPSLLIKPAMLMSGPQEKRKLNVAEADRALARFVQDGYLLRVRQGEDKGKGQYGLGPRFLVELGDWLQEQLEEDMDICSRCNKLLAVGVSCTNRDCGAKFHLYCVDLPGKNVECTLCRTPLKIGGVSTKRRN